MIDSIRDQLQKSFGDAYTIEGELGGGGMSRVFIAHENVLRRTVVVKVLPPELATELSNDRFAQEVKVAAPLQDDWHLGNDRTIHEIAGPIVPATYSTASTLCSPAGDSTPGPANAAGRAAISVIQHPAGSPSARH